MDPNQNLSAAQFGAASNANQSLASQPQSLSGPLGSSGVPSGGGSGAGTTLGSAATP